MYNMKGGFKRMALSSEKRRVNLTTAAASDLLFGQPTSSLQHPALGAVLVSLSPSRFLSMRKCCLPALLPWTPSPPRAFSRMYLPSSRADITSVQVNTVVREAEQEMKT